CQTKNNTWISTEEFMEDKYTNGNKCKLKSTTSKRENNELSELTDELLSLNNQKDSKKSIGKLVIKKEDEILKINEFTIQEKYRNNGYSIEMFKEAIKGIETNKTEAVALFGDVSSVITKGSNKVIDIQE